MLAQGPCFIAAGHTSTH